MDDVLHKQVVLVLNRNWLAVNTTTAAHAFCQMSSGSATGLDIDGDQKMLPVNWENWLDLDVRGQDLTVTTVRGAIRVPTVIVLAHYSKIPLRRPKFSYRAIRDRDDGQCQYTGRRLRPDEGNIDHVVPRSKGGKTSWDNCVLSCKRVNNRKGGRTPKEAGLQLIQEPEAPQTLPITMFLRNLHGIPDWDHFLISAG